MRRMCLPVIVLLASSLPRFASIRYSHDPQGLSVQQRSVCASSTRQARLLSGRYGKGCAGGFCAMAMGAGEGLRLRGGGDAEEEGNKTGFPAKRSGTERLLAPVLGVKESFERLLMRSSSPNRTASPNSENRSAPLFDHQVNLASAANETEVSSWCTTNPAKVLAAAQWMSSLKKMKVEGSVESPSLNYTGGPGVYGVVEDWWSWRVSNHGKALVLEAGLIAAPRVTLAVLAPMLDPTLAALANSSRARCTDVLERWAPGLAQYLLPLLFLLSPKTLLLPLLLPREATFLVGVLAVHAYDDFITLLTAPASIAGSEVLHGVGLSIAAVLQHMLPRGRLSRYFTDVSLYMHMVVFWYLVMRPPTKLALSLALIFRLEI